MAKPDQMLTIEPSSELKFRGPFTSPVISYIKLTNPSEHVICFKIKTTAPKKYCVRPNSGMIQPSNTVEIAVTVQPFDFDLNERNKHKFQVQWTKVLAYDDDFNLDNLWKAPSDSVMDLKLRCVFEMPNSNASNLNNSEEDTKKRDVYSSITSSEPIDPEIQKATNEIARLREELSASQRENIQLKEDMLKARHSQQHVPSTFTNVRSNQTALSEGNQFTTPVMLGIVFGVMIALIAVFLKQSIF